MLDHSKPVFDVCVCVCVCVCWPFLQMSASVGDDVWGDDPTVNSLQAFAAAMFGKEDAIFCPSGTMTNQVAIKVHAFWHVFQQVLL